jgi:hypothetical protein
LSENQKEIEGRTDYLRPHQNWICRGDGQTCACPFGPDVRGNCQASTEKKCRPRLSLRAKRRRFTVAVSIASIAMILIGCWQPWRADFLAPGPLSASHSQLFQQQSAGQNRCAVCHEAGQSSPLDWLADALSGGKHIPVPQSDKCMQCHEQTLVSQWAQFAHGLAPAELQQVNSELTDVSHNNRRLFQNVDAHHSGAIACANCHREHHGSNHELAALTDTQCQTCHANQYQSFAHDHPDLGDWTTRISLGIEFDHAKHLHQHFPQQQTAFDCQQCHTADASGNVQLLAGFEQSCASCHEKTIQSQTAGGVALVALPMIDPEALKAHGTNVGQWPANATGDFDGQIPPLMQMLLAGDQQGKAALESLGNDFDFLDLDLNDPHEMLAAADLIWAIKRLVHDLATKGETGLRERLEKSLPRQIDQPKIDQLIRLISYSAARDSLQQWFSDLDQELQQNSSQQAAITQMQPDSSEMAPPSTDGSPIQRVALIEDLNQELLQENPLTPKYAERLPKVIQSNRPVAASEQFNSRSENNTIPGNLQREPHAQDTATLPIDKSKGETLLLHENPLKHLHDPNESVQSPLIPVEDFPAQTIESNQPNNSDSLLTPGVKVQRYPATDQAANWVRSDETVSLVYVPNGHADPFVKAWLDVLVASTQQSPSPLNATISRKQLGDENLTGLTYCLSCHQTDHEQRAVSWEATYRDPHVRSFTRFDHGPHVIQSTLDNCQTCHRLNDAAFKQKLTSVSGIQPTLLTASSLAKSELQSLCHSDFAAIGKSNCVQCHNQNAASQSCTQCHGYHVGSQVLK